MQESSNEKLGSRLVGIMIFSQMLCNSLSGIWGILWLLWFGILSRATETWHVDASRNIVEGTILSLISQQDDNRLGSRKQKLLSYQGLPLLLSTILHPLLPRHTRQWWSRPWMVRHNLTEFFLSVGQRTPHRLQVAIFVKIGKVGMQRSMLRIYAKW